MGAHRKKCKKTHTYRSPAGKRLSPIVWAVINLQTYTVASHEHHHLSVALQHAEAAWIYHSNMARFDGKVYEPNLFSFSDRDRYVDAVNKAIDWLSIFDRSINSMRDWNYYE